jgi:lipoprotein signal peptidase
MTTTAARSYRWLFWTLAIVGLAADQASKYVLFRDLYNDGDGGRIVLIPGAFYFDVPRSRDVDVPDDYLRPLRAWSGPKMPTVNEGALFGIGQGKNLAFGLVSVFAAAVVLYWSHRPQAARDPFLCVALGLILAGTLGNLYDRLVFDGVRDFLHWNKWFDWYVFNIADVCLVVGASMLVLEAFFARPKTQPADNPPLGGDAIYAGTPPESAIKAGKPVENIAVTSVAE